MWQLPNQRLHAPFLVSGPTAVRHARAAEPTRSDVQCLGLHRRRFGSGGHTVPEGEEQVLRKEVRDVCKLEEADELRRYEQR